VCKVKGDQVEWDVPLMLLEVGKDNLNHLLFEDYRRWFKDWGGFIPAPHTYATAGHNEATPAANKKVSRNDPCPCGSGKKFKKCCLRKENGESIFAH
jgi:hypothetical protein